MPTSTHAQRCCLLLLGCLLAPLCPTVLAQPTENAPTTRQIYTPADFERFAPRSALDMVRQVPGFVLREGGGERGFGQADTNVLINGRRIPGKSNGPVEALGRITASSVVQLVVLDGASLDIGGLSGQVLNVVISDQTRLSGRFQYNFAHRTEQDRWQTREFDASIAGSSADNNWTLRLANEQGLLAESGPERVFDAQGLLTDVRPEARIDTIDQPNLSGSYSRVTGHGNVLNLTGELNGYLFETEEISDRLLGTLDASRRLLRETEDEYNYELGADYEFDLGTGRLKLIALHRFESSPTTADARSVFENGAPDQGTFFSRDADEAESILRSEYAFSAFDGGWNWAVELTENYLDIESELALLDIDGRPVPVPFPGADSRVEELRGESMLSYTRQFTSTLQLQGSIGAEYSEISQSGPSDVVRDFVRPKGFVSLNWKSDPATVLSLRLERVVGQLNFFDFIATVNVNQEQVNVSNVALVPPQSWLTEIEYQRSLGPYGNLTLSGFYDDITDIVDRIPIDGGGQAPGNLDSATRTGVSLATTLLTDPLGWTGGRFDISVDYVDSEVIDPVLNTPRRITGDDYRTLDVTFRQDFASTDWAAGGQLFYEDEAPSVRIDEVSLFRQEFGSLSFYVEHKDLFGLTVRGTVGNLLRADNRFRRTVYADRAGDIALFSEDRRRDAGTTYSLRVEGSF